MDLAPWFSRTGSAAIRTCGGSWRRRSRTDFRTILFDHVGAGRSDLSAYDPEKYASLTGYAEDVIEIGRELKSEQTRSSSATPSAP